MNRNKLLEESELSELYTKLSLFSRDQVILILAIETGARATEILNLRLNDLYLDTNTILIKTLKHGKIREIPIRPELMQSLIHFIPFNIKYRRLEQIWRKYRPCNKPFHCLRHTFAVNLYRRTKDLKLVQLALGHKDITTTSVYQDFEYSREEMSRISSLWNPTV